MDQLLGFSEFALALAGFASIALVLGRREGVLPAGAGYVVRFMISNSLGPALLALLAVVLLELAVPQPALWRICSGLYLAVAVVAGVAAAREEVQLAGEGALVFPPALRRTFWAMSGLAHLCQLVNLVGVPFAPSVGLLLLGLWVLLALAGLQFTALLFVTLR